MRVSNPGKRVYYLWFNIIIYVSNASDTEFRLSLALGNEMIRLVKPFLQINNIYFRLKRLCLKVYAEGAMPTVCFLKSAFSENLQWRL